MTAVLDLRPECVTKPGLTDLIRVEVAMLWPGEPLKQEHAFNVYLVERLMPEIHAMELDLCRKYATVAAGLAISKAPNYSIRKLAEANRSWGYIFGLVLREAIIKHDAGEEGWGVGRIIKDYMHTNRSLDIEVLSNHKATKKTYENRAKFWKPVAHLWAAHMEYLKADQKVSFPCAMKDLAPFLALANFFRERGEEVRPKGSSEPLLPPGAALRFPGLDLPKFSLN